MQLKHLRKRTRLLKHLRIEAPQEEDEEPQAEDN